VYDQSGEGIIHHSEFRRGVSSLMHVAADEMASVLAQLPSDGCDWESFASMYRQAVATGGIPGVEDFKDAFVSFDKDGNKKLDLNEFLSVFHDCAPAEVTVQSEQNLRDLFNIIDTNGDGNLDLDEVVKYISKVWVETFAQDYEAKDEDLWHSHPNQRRGSSFFRPRQNVAPGAS